MAIGDILKGVVSDVLGDMLRKATGATKRRKRRTKTLTPTQRLEKIEKLLKPARKQTSRKRTVRTRAQSRRRSA